jgi:hypothetical protein
VETRPKYKLKYNAPCCVDTTHGQTRREATSQTPITSGDR